MKRLLISTACAIFICGTACAREVTLSPTFTLHGSTIFAARHACNQTAPWARPANSARRSTFQPATTEAGTFAGLWTAQTEWRRRARPLTSVARAAPGAAFADVRVFPLNRMLARVSARPRLCRRHAPSQASITNLLRNLKTAKVVSIDDRPPNVS
jgi:hypothetical protein